MMWYSSIAIAFIAFLIFDLCLKKSRAGKLLDKVPGPKAYPVIGNTLQFLLNPVDLFELGCYYASKYGGLYRIWVGHMKYVVLCAPDDIGIVLFNSKYNKKGSIYKYLKPWLNDGLLLSSGDKWYARRKMLTNAFHFNILKQLFVVVESNSQYLVQAFRDNNEKCTNIVPVVANYTLNNICETTMGTTLHNESSEASSRYEKAIYGYGEIVVYRLVRPWFFYDTLFAMSKNYKHQVGYVKSLHGFTNAVIAERKKHVTENVDKILIDVRQVKVTKRRLAFLDLMLTAEIDGLIDEEGVKEEVNTFMFEGHDTTAMGLCFILMLLANNRTEQDRAYEEIKDINDEGSLRLESLSQLQYLEWCLKEGLRLYPSVPFIIRSLDSDVQLTDYVVPAGTECCIHIYTLHRRADLWPEPLVFRPERFRPDAPLRHPFAYLPFSAGPRNCIGQKFAMMQLKSIMVAILRNFILEPVTKPDDVVLFGDLVLRARDPIYVKFVPRLTKV